MLSPLRSSPAVRSVDARPHNQVADAAPTAQVGQVEVDAQRVVPTGAGVEARADGSNLERSDAFARAGFAPDPRSPAAQASGSGASVQGSGSTEAAGQASGLGEAAQTSETMELSAAEKKEVQQLQARDAEVRAHEQAHAAAGGSHAGSPNYEFQTGPDGKRYAVGGSVSIDTGEVAGDAEASIQKLEQVARAATAPAEPSGQDRKVAAQARMKIATLRAEMASGEGEQAPAAEVGDAESAESASASGEGGPSAQGAMAAKSYAAQASYDQAPPSQSLDITACANCGGGH